MREFSVVLRTPSGLSGDMLVTGLSQLSGLNQGELNAIVNTLGIAALQDVICVQPHSVNGISGWKAHIELHQEHHHRTLAIIRETIAVSGLDAPAKEFAIATFEILGRAEAQVHDIPLEDVTFHEVGALDSILDICVCAALLSKLAPVNLYCSPLPICDGTIKCEHGYLASPAPAVQEMLRNVPVYGIDSQGETVTPTAIAFLLAAGAQFGKWPDVTIIDVVRAYGGRILPNIQNGAMFFLVSELR